MRFLVTGDCGFIGGNLAKRLLDDGHEVYGYDNWSSSSCIDRIEGVNYDISTEKKMDGVFHLGMGSSSPMYKNDSVIRSTIETTLFAIRRAKADKCPVVFATTSSIYNGYTLENMKENVYGTSKSINTIPCVSDCYTDTRYYIERLFKNAWEKDNVRSIGLRLFSVYGPRDKQKGKYANNITQFALGMMKGERPAIYGDGTQTRDFIHVDRVVDAFCLAMKKLKKKKAECDIINVGTGESMCFNELIDLINSTYDMEIIPKYVKNPIKNYVQDTKACTSKMEKLMEVPYLPKNDIVRYLVRLKDEEGY